MLANLQRTLGLWFKEKTGLTAAVLIYSGGRHTDGFYISTRYRVCLGSGGAWSRFRRSCHSRRISGDRGVLLRRGRIDISIWTPPLRNWGQSRSEPPQRPQCVRGITYVFSGFSMGVAGLLAASELSCAQAQMEPIIVFDVIAVVVLGGTSWNGGVGAVAA
jgi:hypothetical protein